jgi:hypothetical protein
MSNPINRCALRIHRPIHISKLMTSYTCHLIKSGDISKTWLTKYEKKPEEPEKKTIETHTYIYIYKDRELSISVSVV